jgi:hypothetical protein
VAAAESATATRAVDLEPVLVGDVFFGFSIGVSAVPEPDPEAEPDPEE